MATTSGLAAPGGRLATELVPPVDGELAVAMARAKAAGRWPPRVLHIGNIANNAYLNARILNQAGIPSDVLVYDYYHVMGCPEWEEAEIIDLPQEFDENRLDWSMLTLRDFERPAWFSQGPFRWATAYLESRASGRDLEAARYWRLLKFYRWLHARQRLEVVFRKLVGLRARAVNWWAWVRFCWLKGSYYARSPFARAWGFVLRVVGTSKHVAGRAVDHCLRKIHCAPRADVGAAGADRGVPRALQIAAPVGAMTLSVPAHGERAATGAAAPTSTVTPAAARRPDGTAAFAAVAASAVSAGTVAASVAPASAPTVAAAIALSAESGDAPPVDPLIMQFARFFPDRVDQLTAEDLAPYRGSAASFKALLDRYDVVVGYSTDPVWPMVAEHPCYMAFEHGTIRAIPFEHTAQGRLTALSYRTAKCSFITNCDEIRAIEKLKLDNATFVPHPMNDRLLAQADGSTVRKDLETKFDTDFVIFHPARQHWELTRNPSLEKGNDLFLRAFARFVREVDPKALLVAVRWGKSLADTDELLAEQGITSRVHWIKPVPNRTMLNWVAASDVVADQFWLGCFGGITPKAYGMGKPVAIYLDREIHNWCFPYLPPHIEERSPAAIFEFMARLYQDPSHMKSVAQGSRAWYVKYHSEASIRDRLVRALVERWALTAVAPVRTERSS